MSLAAGFAGLIAGEPPPGLPGAPETQLGPLLIDSATGRWLGLTDSTGRGKYALTGWGFRVWLEGATLDSSSARSVQRQAGRDTLRVTYEYPGYRVDQLLREAPGTAFCDYTLRIHRNDGRGFFVGRVECGRFAFRRAPDQVILHTDGSILEDPINLFLRYPKGGVILGIAYPYQELAPAPDGRRFQSGISGRLRRGRRTGVCDRAGVHGHL